MGLGGAPHVSHDNGEIAGVSGSFVEMCYWCSVQCSLPT